MCTYEFVIIHLYIHEFTRAYSQIYQRVTPIYGVLSTLIPHPRFHVIRSNLLPSRRYNRHNLTRINRPEWNYYNHFPYICTARENYTLSPHHCIYPVTTPLQTPLLQTTIHHHRPIRREHIIRNYSI